MQNFSPSQPFKDIQKYAELKISPLKYKIGDVTAININNISNTVNMNEYDRQNSLNNEKRGGGESDTVFLISVKLKSFLPITI